MTVKGIRIVLCVKEMKYRENDAVRTGVLAYNDSGIYISWDSEVDATVDRDHVSASGEPIIKSDHVKNAQRMTCCSYRRNKIRVWA